MDFAGIESEVVALNQSELCDSYKHQEPGTSMHLLIAPMSHLVWEGDSSPREVSSGDHKKIPSVPLQSTKSLITWVRHNPAAQSNWSLGSLGSHQ